MCFYSTFTDTQGPGNFAVDLPERISCNTSCSRTVNGSRDFNMTNNIRLLRRLHIVISDKVGMAFQHKTSWWFSGGSITSVMQTTVRAIPLSPHWEARLMLRTFLNVSAEDAAYISGKSQTKGLCRVVAIIQHISKDAPPKRSKYRKRRASAYLQSNSRKCFALTA